MDLLQDPFTLSTTHGRITKYSNMVDQPLDIGSSSFSNSQIAETSVSECMCYSFDLSRSPPPQTRRCKSGRATLFDLAKNIKCSYFTSPRDENINPDPALSMLKIFCSVLNDNVNTFSEIDYNAENEEYLAHVLDRILFETKVEDMSTFEFIEIGIVKSIINYLCDGLYFQRERLYPDFQCRGHVVMQRCQTFARMMSSKYCSREDLMLAVFVGKLQSSLISLCNLPVILSQPFKSRDGVYADIPYICTTLHPCFNVKFVKDEADNVLRDCSARVLRVEPSSSFSAIEKYLLPNIAPNKTASGLVGKGMIELVDDLNLSQLMVNEGSVPGSHSFKCLESSVKQETPISSTEKFSELRPCKIRKFTDPQKETSAEAKMSFYLHDKKIDKSLTIYQAIIQQKANLQSDMVLNNMFWNQVYTITYKTTDSREIHPPTNATENDSLSFWAKLPFFSSLLSAELPFQLKRENPFYDILFLLRTLEGVNKYAFILLSNEGLHGFNDQLKGTLLIPESELLSSKFSEKLEQQMADNFSSLTGNMRAWFSCLVALCPFLLSFDVRSTFFRVAQLAFQRTNQIQRTNQEDYNIDSLRVPWSVFYSGKFGVDRNHILESAKKIMELNAHIEVTLDVEYDNEIGTGKVPTMEFYTLASREFQKRGLNLWRGDYYPSTLPVCPAIIGELVDVKYVDAPMGLFPRPWSTIADFFNENQFSEVILKFKLLGWLVARAIYDKRILDLHFSKVFYKLILGKELGIHDISSFDPELGRTLLEFQSLARRKRYLEENSSGNCETHFRDVRIEDLYIDFTLPGYADYALFTDEDSKMVSSANLEEYIFLVVDATVRSGILRQMEAFECGFNEVFPMRNLCIFSEQELEQMLCGEQDTWTFEELLDNIKFDHGYTVRSAQVLDFLEIILEFKCHERRAFLQFVTGAPRLPFGGLAALTPKLTVVRKHVSGCADMELPSVSTCTNYLKLPPYSSKEKTRERLLYAITEGQGSFHLS